jgi:hypothetical protein
MKQEQDNTIPRFYIKAVQHNFRSQQEGRPIFEDKEYVQIIIPGDNRSEVDRQVQEQDKDRWPEAYRKFKEDGEQATDGTPLEQWPAVSVSQVAELKAKKIRTVEQLAGITDGQLNNLGLGARQLRDRAKAFLEAAAGNAPLDAALLREAKLQEEIDALKAQVASIISAKDQSNGRDATGAGRNTGQEGAAVPEA